VSTTYIIFCDVYNDPVWGAQFVEQPNSGLVRVFRNRLRKAVFEYVGCPKIKFDLAATQRRFPVCRFADQNNAPLSHSARAAPLPDRRHK
jgi:hypothetical protein